MSLLNPYRFGALGPTISTEAQSVLDQYSALTTTEEDAIIELINDYSVSLGNGEFSKIQQIWNFNLNSTDRLIPFKSNSPTAVNNGCTFDINGATANGSSDYINLSWNPFDDGVTWDAQNNFCGFYMHDWNDSGSNHIIMGAYGTLGDDTYDINQNSDTSIIGNFGNIGFPANFAQGFADQKNYTIDTNRDGSNSSYLWEDGVNVLTDSGAAVAGDGVADVDLYLFARNTNGTAGFYTAATVPLVIIGDNGFDHSYWNTRVKTYLAALGMTIP